MTTATDHTLVIQYRNGDDAEHTMPEADAEQVWTQLTDSCAHAVQYAAWRVPATNARSYRVRGTFGTPREDMPALRPPEDRLEAEHRAAVRREQELLADLARERRIYH